MLIEVVVAVIAGLGLWLLVSVVVAVVTVVIVVVLPPVPAAAAVVPRSSRVVGEPVGQRRVGSTVHGMLAVAVRNVLGISNS